MDSTTIALIITFYILLGWSTKVVCNDAAELSVFQKIMAVTLWPMVLPVCAMCIDICDAINKKIEEDRKQ